jgi:hypothetical protein
VVDESCRVENFQNGSELTCELQNRRAASYVVGAFDHHLSLLLSSKMGRRVSVTYTKLGIYMKTTCAGLVGWPTLALPRVLPRFEGLGGGDYGGIWPNAPQRKYRDSSDLACETSSPRIRRKNIPQYFR